AAAFSAIRLKKSPKILPYSPYTASSVNTSKYHFPASSHQISSFWRLSSLSFCNASLNSASFIYIHSSPHHAVHSRKHIFQRNGKRMFFELSIVMKKDILL